MFLAMDTEVFFGKFTDDILSNYWISSSNDHPITIDSSVLSDTPKIDYDGSRRSTTINYISVNIYF